MTDDRTPRIGKHTFETLTTGMYLNPLDCIREYLQNSVDAIEEANRPDGGRIDIRINPGDSSIVVSDDGCGIEASAARGTLEDVGLSRKRGAAATRRGFRGIGRLGGIAYCRELVFTTKAAGDRVVTQQVWDCDLVRELLRPDQHATMSMGDLISSASTVVQQPHTGVDDAFFRVEMRGVSEQLLLDVKEVRAYLGSVAPIGFDHSKFSYGAEIEQFLAREVPDYVAVNLFVNDQRLYKPYGNTVGLSRAPGRKKGAADDHVRDVDYMTLASSTGTVFAHCWMAKTDLKGMVDPESGVSGIRVRVGNIALGNGTAIEGCFPRSDKRFAAYLVGEIHVVDSSLVPNGRRDAFEHNEARDEFMAVVARQIAEPSRKKIRDASNNRSSQKAVQQAQHVRAEADDVVTRGVTSEGERDSVQEQILGSLDAVRDLGPGAAVVAEQLEETASAVVQAPRMVDLELLVWRQSMRNTFQGLFDIVYEGASDKDWANRTIKKMVSYLKQAKQGDGHQ